MSTFSLKDARVEVNGVDLSDWVTGGELPIEYEALEDTAMGDSGRSRIVGLQDSTIKIDFTQDFGSSAVDATISATLGTVITIKVRPTSGSISTTNPEYVGSYLVSQYQPFGNSIGELATTSVSWPLSDPDGIARNTS